MPMPMPMPTKQEQASKQKTSEALQEVKNEAKALSWTTSASALFAERDFRAKQTLYFNNLCHDEDDVVHVYTEEDGTTGLTKHRLSIGISRDLKKVLLDVGSSGPNAQLILSSDHNLFQQVHPMAFQSSGTTSTTLPNIRVIDPGVFMNALALIECNFPDTQYILGEEIIKNYRAKGATLKIITPNLLSIGHDAFKTETEGLFSQITLECPSAAQVESGKNNNRTLTPIKTLEPQPGQSITVVDTTPPAEAPLPPAGASSKLWGKSLSHESLFNPLHSTPKSGEQDNGSVQETERSRSASI